MDTKRLSASDPHAIAQAVTVCRAGGIVAFPTDTVYGVGALVREEKAVRALFQVKGRDTGKAIPVLIATLSQLEGVVRSVPPLAHQLAARFWPGPLTLVLPRHPALSPVVTGGGETVAVRMPAHDVALQLLRTLGEPLATTSANRAGEPSATTADEVLAQLAGRIALVLDGGPSLGGVPSTVLDLTTKPPSLLRRGPVGPADWHDLLPSVAEPTR